MVPLRSTWLGLMAAGVLSLPACGAEDGDQVSADAGPASEFACSEVMSGGDAFEMSLGYRVPSGDFFAIADGDQVPMTIGYQGLYMLVLESRAAVSLDTDRVCFECAVELAPATTAFSGTSQHGPIDFVAMSTGDFSGGFNVIVGPTSEEETYAGAEVQVLMSCEGHGFSGNVERSFTLLGSG